MRLLLEDCAFLTVLFEMQRPYKNSHINSNLMMQISIKKKNFKMLKVLNLIMIDRKCGSDTFYWIRVYLFGWSVQIVSSTKVFLFILPSFYRFGCRKFSFLLCLFSIYCDCFTITQIRLTSNMMWVCETSL